MNRLARGAAGALLAALALAGCGGSGGSAPAPAVPQAAPNGAARHVSSTCTPDSYGYCLALVSQDQEFATCSNGFEYQTESDYYQLYHNNVSDGFYTYSNTGRSSRCPPPYAWSPRDPSAATGDPDLP